MMYITYDNLYAQEYTGIRKKILGQIQVLKKHFPRVYLTCCCGQMIYLMDGENIIDKEFAATKATCNHILDKWLDDYGIKKIYVRYGRSDQWFIQFLKRQKEKNIKSVLEIPTYPYDEELGWKRMKLEDTYYRSFLNKYIDLIATNIQDEYLWGMRCVCLVNGVDLKSNPLRKRKLEKDRIVLLGVSGLLLWQGYERIIEGLNNYYKKEEKYRIFFRIVGEGPEKERYISLVEQYGLQEHVEFCGRLEGMELDRQYDEADIAVSSLGRYKTKIDRFTPIKGAEYCARGIPFICGYQDMRFSERETFIMNVSNNPEPIDMNRVIIFYENINNQKGYQNEMRSYAAEHLTWDSIMKPIVNFFK